MAPPREEPYFVEVNTNGCGTCGAGRTWLVIGPDDYAGSQTFSDEEDADALAESLNAAYASGRETAGGENARLRDYAQHLPKCAARKTRMASGQCFAAKQVNDHEVYCLLKAGHDGEHENHSLTWIDDVCTCGLSAALYSSHVTTNGKATP